MGTELGIFLRQWGGALSCGKGTPKAGSTFKAQTCRRPILWRVDGRKRARLDMGQVVSWGSCCSGRPGRQAGGWVGNASRLTHGQAASLLPALSAAH